jgi:hypothetical protein
MADRLIRTERLLPSGEIVEVPKEELERLEAEKRQDELAGIIFVYADGDRFRPYRFGSVEAEFDGDTVVL